MWIIDSCVVVDILGGDQPFALLSARCLHELTQDGLGICPISFAELGPMFPHIEAQHHTLNQIGIDYSQNWLAIDTVNAATAWKNYARRKKIDPSISKRPIADILIGSFAGRFQGLITRNPKDFAPHFPELTIIDPTNFSDSKDET